jgi:tRNA threonylcarbamoyladenosine biosynthesis protein TsaB
VNLLALDTSTPTAALAVVRSGQLARGHLSDPNQRHGRTLLRDVRDLMAEAGLALGDLDGLVVGLGPGSFTGLRIGVTAAKVIAYAIGRPVFGVDSLELLARCAPAYALTVVSLADAQRGEVAAAVFRRDQPGGPLVKQGPTRVVPRATLLGEIDPGATVVGASKGWTGPTGPTTPTVKALAALAVDVANLGRSEDIWFLEPVYARPSAAEENAARLPDEAGPTHVS